MSFLHRREGGERVNRTGRKRSKTTRPTGGRAGKTKAARRPFVLDDGLKKLIRQEARKFGISEEEYLRLVVHFSEAVTSKVMPAGLLDGDMLKLILNNPMVLNMLKGFIGNMVGKMGKGGAKAAPQETPSAPGGLRLPGMPGFPGGAPHGGHPAQRAMPRMPGFPAPGMPGMQGPPFGMRPPQGRGLMGLPGMAMPGVPVSPEGGSSAREEAESEDDGDGGGVSMEALAQMMAKMFGS